MNEGSVSECMLKNYLGNLTLFSPSINFAFLFMVVFGIATMDAAMLLHLRHVRNFGLRKLH